MARGTSGEAVEFPIFQEIIGAYHFLAGVAAGISRSEATRASICASLAGIVIQVAIFSFGTDRQAIRAIQEVRHSAHRRTTRAIARC